MSKHPYQCVLAYLAVLCLALVQPQVQAAFIESFEPMPADNTTKYLSGLWMQVGRFVEDGKALVGENKGFSLFLDAANPAAETTMLQWDGNTPADVAFEVIRYDMPGCACALQLFNTTDGEVWSQHWSEMIGQWPYKIWITVRIPLALAKQDTKFALRWQYLHACCGGSCCPGVTINNIVFPAKPPTAATLILKARTSLGSTKADTGTDNAITTVPSRPTQPSGDAPVSNTVSSDAKNTPHPILRVKSTSPASPAEAPATNGISADGPAIKNNTGTPASTATKAAASTPSAQVNVADAGDSTALANALRAADKTSSSSPSRGANNAPARPGASNTATASVEQGSAQDDWQKGVHKAIAKVCEIKAFAAVAKDSQSCKLWSDEEAQDFGIGISSYMSGQSGHFPMPLSGDLPQHVNSRGGTSRGLALVSPACSGRAVARTVFKSIQQPAKSSSVAGIRLLPFTNISLIKASPVVRCLLTLDGTNNELPETERALASKEEQCYVCADKGGCPSKEGAWFSDAFTFDVPGCKLDGTLPYPVFVQLVLTPGWKALVAKFEVCKSFGCFDPDYEAKKLKDAKTCTAQDC